MMKFKEADTGATITAEMIGCLADALGLASIVDEGGKDYVVRADHLDSTINILEQLARQL